MNESKGILLKDKYLLLLYFRNLPLEWFRVVENPLSARFLFSENSYMKLIGKCGIWFPLNEG